MRAFRPSYFTPAEEFEEDEQRAKDANVERYAERAEAGLPLFDTLNELAPQTRNPMARR